MSGCRQGSTSEAAELSSSGLCVHHGDVIEAGCGLAGWNREGTSKRSLVQMKETSMATKLHWLQRAALVAGALATASPALSQAARPWVDPPLENGSSPSGATPNAVETKPTSAPATPTAAKMEPEPTLKPPAKKTVVEKKQRVPTREASVSSRPRQQRGVAVSSSAPLRQPMGLTREERVRQGLDSGLELMTLRTIEYPDGRRVQILTRPGPNTMSELLEARR